MTPSGATSGPITLYKFRPLEKMERVLDVLLCERLHCANYEKLNDPYEGQFFEELTIETRSGDAIVPGAPNGGLTRLRKVEEILAPGTTIPKICSLSSDLSDVRLWSFYAGDHTGVAIELQFPTHPQQLHQVTYPQNGVRFTNTFVDSTHMVGILTKKSPEWSFESEYRILHDSDFFPVNGLIKAVYCGIRAQPNQIEILRRATRGKLPIFPCVLSPYNSKVIKDPWIEISDYVNQFQTKAQLLERFFKTEGKSLH